jgi:sugar lactone lactonase YvrE
MTKARSSLFVVRPSSFIVELKTARRNAKLRTQNSKLNPRDILLALLGGLALLSSCVARPAAEPFATGLDEPRGLAFDDAGDLYVAEAGALDPHAAAQSPVTTNQSGRVVRIAPNGQVTTVADGLPFTHYTEPGTDIGPTDVTMLAGTLYVLTGEGYDNRLSRAVLRVVPGAPPQPVASLLNFAMADSRLSQMIGANAIAANPYAMVTAPDGSALYVADGASGRLLQVTLDGNIRVFAELPNMPPLTGLAFGPDGRLYFADFSPLPHMPGSGAVWAADSSGKPAIAAANLTMPIDVGFDAAGAMYVLEFGDGRQTDQPYAGGSGRLLRVEHDGARTVVLDRLNYPTAMAFSHLGDLYIALSGAFTAPGQGSILKVPCSALGVPEACPHEPTQ